MTETVATGIDEIDLEVGSHVCAFYRGSADRDRLLTAADVSAAAEEITGSPLPVPPAVLAAALDPGATVTARNATGGADPARVREHARAVRARVQAATRWHSDQRTRAERCEEALLAAARALVGDR